MFVVVVLACEMCQTTDDMEKSSYSAMNNVNLWNTFIDDETYTIPWRLNPEDPVYNSTIEYIPIVAKQLEENTCLRFKPWSGEKSWLLLLPAYYGCYTRLGRPDEGKRTVSLLQSQIDQTNVLLLALNIKLLYTKEVLVKFYKRYLQ